jgi:hypothetical protein
MLVEVTRLNKHGKGLCLFFTAAIRSHTNWRHGDRIAVRPVGEKLILERVPLERLGKINTGEAEGRSA